MAPGRCASAGWRYGRFEAAGLWPAPFVLSPEPCFACLSGHWPDCCCFGRDGRISCQDSSASGEQSIRRTYDLLAEFGPFTVEERPCAAPDPLVQVVCIIFFIAADS